jgi:hypothetical protein
MAQTAGLGLGLLCLALAILAFFAGAAWRRSPSPATFPPDPRREEAPPPPPPAETFEPDAPPGHQEARDAPPPASCPDPEFSPRLSFGYPYSYALDSPDPADEGENRMYSSAEVDPRVAGQLYAGARAAGTGRRWVYGGRVSFGDRWGMREFSTGVPGQTGVDVGPLGMCEYSLDGAPDVFDDGIPAQWRMPSTPVNWYKPRQRDFYSVEDRAGRPYAEHLVSLREPDHEPLFS